MLNGKCLTTARLTLTYQTRLVCPAETDQVLSAVAGYMSRVERDLYVRYRHGASLRSLKNETVARYRIPARSFNAVKASLEGKITSVLSNLDRIVKEYDQRLNRQAQKIKQLSRQLKQPQAPEDRRRLKTQRHQRQRRLATLRARQARLKARLDAKDPAICFGSKVLFKQQHQLAAHGYASHAAWQHDWRAARKAQFMVVGSKDESLGCQLCQLTPQPDGSLTARLRVPDALAGSHGKYLQIPHIRFAYGQEAVHNALRACQRRAALQSKAARAQQGDRYQQYGQAITYRFVKDAKGWRLFASTKLPLVKPVSCPSVGALGVDLNADHLALALVDHHRNPVGKWTVPCHTYGLSSHQAQAVIGDACRRVVALAVEHQVPLVLENLSFSQKKAQLETERSARYARMLSSLAYDRIKQTLRSAASKQGIAVYAVSPAYTSLIGRVKFARQYGYSVHHAAAVAIARRLFNGSEKLPQGLPQLGLLPVWDDRRGLVTLPSPEDGGKHVWSRWRQLSRSLQAALAGHSQQRHRRSPVTARPWLRAAPPEHYDSDVAG